jgi:hypothetical protein
MLDKEDIELVHNIVRGFDQLRGGSVEPGQV